MVPRDTNTRASSTLIAPAMFCQRERGWGRWGGGVIKVAHVLMRVPDVAPDVTADVTALVYRDPGKRVLPRELL